jgi:hypothetical protein
MLINPHYIASLGAILLHAIGMRAIYRDYLSPLFATTVVVWALKNTQIDNWHMFLSKYHTQCY